jgi:hypothetical protein
VCNYVCLCVVRLVFVSCLKRNLKSGSGEKLNTGQRGCLPRTTRGVTYPITALENQGLSQVLGAAPPLGPAAPG